MHGSSITKSEIALETGIKISSFVSGLIFLVFCNPTSALSPEEELEKMSLDQKVGQLMIWSYSGTDFTSNLKRTLVRYRPGALIAFRRNIKSPSQIAQFNLAIQKFARTQLKYPLFLMVDQEGGVVTRIRTGTPLPSALALGRIKDVRLLESFARTTGEFLFGLGFNVNLAPVLDISNPTRDSFIGSRAFGDDPILVAQQATAYSRGLHSGGVIPTAKHFPGHGGIIQDSHKEIPSKTSTLDELKKKDLVPFEDFTSASFPRAVMMAHLALPELDASGLPATYSSVIVQDCLRSTLKYSGLVITDDLEMNGASVSEDIGERAILAFLAGNDMLMLAGPPKNQRRAFRAIREAVNSGRISMERLNESVLRILNTKSKLKPPQTTYDHRRTLTTIKKLNMMSVQIIKANYKAALNAVTKPWPEVSPQTQAVVFSASWLFFKRFQNRFQGRARFYHLDPDTLAGAQQTLADPRTDVAIFFATGAKTARWLNRLPYDLREKTIVVNANHMGAIDEQDSFLSVLNVNTYATAVGSLLADSLNTPSKLRTPSSTSDASD
ncbi:MAG: beta-N-acetylhexosaminidase [Bdellovibrionales bacterium]